MLNTTELKVEMVRKGMTNRSLARAIGKNENTVGKKVNGHGCFDVDEIDAICEALEIRDIARKAQIFLG